MFSPNMGELVAREQYKDRLREVEHQRLVDAASARPRANRIDLRPLLGNLLISSRHLFRVLVCAD
jgi:hypothetical protein